MARSSCLLALVFVLCFQNAFPQCEKYFIYFKGKGTGYDIKEVLSEKALKRRQRQKIKLEESDLPVNRKYCDRISSCSGLKIFFASKWLNGVLVESNRAQMEKIAQMPFVSTIHPLSFGSDANRKVALQHSYQLNSLNYGNSYAQIQNLGVDKMHEDGFTGQGIYVAVFDGGFQNADQASSLSPLFQQNRIKFTYSLVSKNTAVFAHTTHGTNVLSCIAAYSPGNLVGTAYDVDLALFVTEDVGSESLQEEYNWLRAAEMADSLGVDIISSSLGYNTFDNAAENHTLLDLDGRTTVISKAASMAARKGILVVNSAGNNYNDPAWSKIVFPADADSILAVGATSLNGKKASFSAVGPTKDGRIKPDVSALGVGVVMNNSGDIFSTGSGTSYSTPLVAGLVAGLWQSDTTLTNIQLIQYIKQSASLYCYPNNELGVGIPNYTIARQLMKDRKQINCDSLSIPANYYFSMSNLPNYQFLYPNPVSDLLTFEMGKVSDEPSVLYRLTDVRGREVLEGEAGNPGYLNLKLDLSYLKPGVYFLKISQKTYKIIKL